MQAGCTNKCPGPSRGPRLHFHFQSPMTGRRENQLWTADLGGGVFRQSWMAPSKMAPQRPRGSSLNQAHGSQACTSPQQTEAELAAPSLPGLCWVQNLVQSGQSGGLEVGLPEFSSTKLGHLLFPLPRLPVRGTQSSHIWIVAAFWDIWQPCLEAQQWSPPLSAGTPLWPLWGGTDTPSAPDCRPLPSPIRLMLIRTEDLGAYLCPPAVWASKCTQNTYICKILTHTQQLVWNALH